MFRNLFLIFIGLCTSNAFAFYTQRPKNFFIVESEGIHINKSHFSDPKSLSDQEIGFATITSTISWNHMVQPHTGLRTEAGQEYIHVAWKNSPEFRRTGYNAFLFNFGVFSDYYENWWIFSQAGFAMDTKYWRIRDYTQFRFVMYTRYNYKERFRIHLGFIGTYGFRYNRVIPIVGIDFSHFKHLKINLVFPTNMSLVWEFNPTLSAILRFRFMQYARRFDEDDIRPRGSLLYDNQSIEFAIRGTIKELISLQGFVGWAIGDEIRIESRNGANRTYYEFDGALMYGAGLFFVF